MKVRTCEIKTTHEVNNKRTLYLPSQVYTVSADGAIGAFRQKGNACVPGNVYTFIICESSGHSNIYRDQTLLLRPKKTQPVFVLQTKGCEADKSNYKFTARLS